jgi:hypothetical protein
MLVPDVQLTAPAAATLTGSSGNVLAPGDTIGDTDGTKVIIHPDGSTSPYQDPNLINTAVTIQQPEAGPKIDFGNQNNTQDSGKEYTKKEQYDKLIELGETPEKAQELSGYVVDENSTTNDVTSQDVLANLIASQNDGSAGGNSNTTTGGATSGVTGGVTGGLPSGATTGVTGGSPSGTSTGVPVSIPTVTPTVAPKPVLDAGTINVDANAPTNNTPTTPLPEPSTGPTPVTNTGGGSAGSSGSGSTGIGGVALGAAGLGTAANNLYNTSLDFTPHVTKGSQIKLVGQPTFSNNMIPTSQVPVMDNSSLSEIENAAEGGLMHYADGGSTSNTATTSPTSGVTKGSSISLVGMPKFTSSLIPMPQFKPTPLEVIQNAAEGGLMGYADGGEAQAPVSLRPQLTHGNARFLQSFMSNIPNAKTGLTAFQHHKEGHSVQDEDGNEIEHNPEFYSEGGLKHTYVTGDGDGTSDSIPAMLANGEFVIPADVVSGLGNGSNDAGAKVLDQFLKVIRHHKRDVDVDHLPPDSKGPLGYLLEAKKKEKVT